MCSEAGHAQLERQRARVGDHDAAAGGLGDHGCLTAVSAQHRRERSESAVLLADHRVERKGPLQRHPRADQRAGDRQIRYCARLHVTCAAAMDRVVLDRPAPGVRVVPLVEVAGRDHVNMTLQDQCGTPAGPRTPTTPYPSVRGASVPG